MILNANPVLLDAQGLNRGHAFINGNDIGLYWFIQKVFVMIHHHVVVNKHKLIV